MKDKAKSQDGFQAPIRWTSRLRRAFFLYGVIPYFTIVAMFAFFQRRLMYQPTVAADLSASSRGLDASSCRDVMINTPDGEVLNGWLIKNSLAKTFASSPLIVYFPGNASNRMDRLYDLRRMSSCGFDVMIFDYRGYGDSSGRPTERNLEADARLIWNYAVGDLAYSENEVVVFGESLGGAVALSLWDGELADHVAPSRLVLKSTFLSMPKVVAWHYPILPLQFLVLDRWPSIRRIGQVPCAVTVFHGTLDEIVPAWHGRRLSEESPNGRFVEIPGAGHNNVPLAPICAELQRIRSEIMTPSG